MQVSNQPNWDADARRIVACVNSCIGLTTAVLESIVMVGDTIADRFAQRNLDESALMAQHKSLLADMELLVARAASRREGAVDTELIVAVMKKHGGAA